MSEKFPDVMPTPANDNKSEEDRIRQAEAMVEMERNRLYIQIANFRFIIAGGDMLATNKEFLLRSIDAVQAALFDEVSTPTEAFARIQTLAKQYGYEFATPPKQQ